MPTTKKDANKILKRVGLPPLARARPRRSGRMRGDGFFGDAFSAITAPARVGLRGLKSIGLAPSDLVGEFVPGRIGRLGSKILRKRGGGRKKHTRR